MTEKSKRFYYRHRDKVRKEQGIYRLKIVLQCLGHYSNGLMKCELCDFDNIDCLTIDHINFDGAKFRKKINSGWATYRWLIKNNFPPGFRVLCRNCNCSINKAKTLTLSRYQKHGQKLKKQVFINYSLDLSCIKCKINNLKVLNLDHVNGGGVKHKKRIKKGRWGKT